MKLQALLIAALNATLVLQFASAPHYIEETYEDPDTGDTVRFLTGDGPAITITSVGGNDEKKTKYVVNVQVPAGRNLKKAVTLELPGNKVRDRIANLLKTAITSTQTGGGGEVEVILKPGDNAAPTA